MFSIAVILVCSVLIGREISLRNAPAASMNPVETGRKSASSEVLDFTADLSHLTPAFRAAVAKDLGVDIPHLRSAPPTTGFFYEREIRESLSHFRGFTLDRSTLERMARGNGPRGSHVRYQIVKGRLFRQKDCWPFPERCKGLEKFLLAAAPRVPDVDFVVNVRDRPQQTGQGLPVLSFSVLPGVHADVMMPAWSFWGGGPAGPWAKRGWRWDVMQAEIASAAEDAPWRNRDERAFFRGSRTCTPDAPYCPRDAWVRLGQERSDLADTGYTEHFVDAIRRGVESAMGIDYVYHAPEPPTRSCAFKYLPNFDGVAASFRLRSAMACGSVVVGAGMNWQEFFYGKLQPWVHYVPSRGDGRDAAAVVEFLRAHDEAARTIGTNARRFIREHLRLEDVHSYWELLLSEYSKLLDFAPTREAGFIEVRG
jgi:protein glucosyltransferase